MRRTKHEAWIYACICNHGTELTRLADGIDSVASIVHRSGTNRFVLLPLRVSAPGLIGAITVCSQATRTSHGSERARDVGV